MNIRTNRTVFSVVATVILLSCTTTPETVSPRVTVSPLFDARVYDRIAIFVEELRRPRLTEGAIRTIEDEFMRAAIERGYTVAARSDLERILQEQRRQVSPVTETAIARMGRAINVSALIVVSVTDLVVDRYTPTVSLGGQRRFQATGRMSARMISAETGEVVWLGSFVGRSRVGARNQGEVVLPWLARVVASGLPIR